MTKFKVGEKVKFTEDFGDYTKGDVVEVIYLINDNHIKFKGEHGKGDCYTHRIQKILSKNQRITALENEVAELRTLKELVPMLQNRVEKLGMVVEQLRKPSTPIKKTANEQRAEIIKKARDFVAKKFIEGNCGVGKVVLGEYGHNVVEFIVNEEKLTVVANLRLAYVNKCSVGKGIAKCNPSDIFNTDIGKAIALGRALGIDVSEFENAVQPTSYSVGQFVRCEEDGEIHVEGELIGVENQHLLNFKSEDYIKHLGRSYKKTSIDGYVTAKIINDTNAIYDEVSE